MSTSEPDPKPESSLTRIARLPYVAGLAEWELFPSEAERLRVLNDIDASTIPRTFGQLIMFLLTVAVLLLGPYFVVGWIMHVVAPGTTTTHNWIRWGITLVTYTVLVFVLIRRDVPKTLRKRLLELGVPVCLPCGYGLKGLPPDREQCPECGRTLSRRVREILRENAEPGEPSAG